MKGCSVYRTVFLALLPLYSLYASETDSSEINTTKAMVIEEMENLYCGERLVTPEYLFDTVVTNRMYDPEANASDWRRSSAYDERYRCFVDLDQDGHDDVILSAPSMQRGSGGLPFNVYLWTNGNFRAIGSIGTHPAFLHVEHVDSAKRIIWTYWKSNRCSGTISEFPVSTAGYARETSLDVDLEIGDEGTTTVGQELYETILRKATVPIRAEISVTENGKVQWRSFDIAKEYR